MAYLLFELQLRKDVDMAYAPNMTCHMQRCGTRPPSLTKQKRHPALQSRLGLSPPRLLGEHGHYVRQHHDILPAWQGGLRDFGASVIPNRGVRTAPAIARLASGVGGARAHRPLRPSARPSRDIPRDDIVIQGDMCARRTR